MERVTFGGDQKTEGITLARDGIKKTHWRDLSPLTYAFLDAILRQTESEAPKPNKARGVISYAERERYTLDDADEEIQSLMDRDMGASG